MDHLPKFEPIVLDGKLILDPTVCPIAGVNRKLKVTRKLFELSLSEEDRLGIMKMMLTAENETYQFYTDETNGWLVALGKLAPEPENLS